MTYEKALERINELLKYAASLDADDLDTDFNDTVALHMVCKNALKIRIPKKPIHFHQVYPKHDWKLYDGEIDTWAWESGFHNGPFCKRCHCAPCEHCNPDYDEEECIVDEKHCPSCDKQVTSTDKFCHNCGQALDWSD